MKWSIVSSDEGLAGVQDFREIGVTSFDELDLWMTRLREREHLFIRVRCLKPPSMPIGVEACLVCGAWQQECHFAREVHNLTFLGRCFGSSWSIEPSYQEEEQSYVRQRVLQTS